LRAPQDSRKTLTEDLGGIERKDGVRSKTEAGLYEGGSITTACGALKQLFRENLIDMANLDQISILRCVGEVKSFDFAPVITL